MKQERIRGIYLANTLRAVFRMIICKGRSVGEIYHKVETVLIP